MNKSELVANVAERGGHIEVCRRAGGRRDVGRRNAVPCEGEPVSLIGFGTFLVRERGSRTGRNPQTGETMEIAASKVAAFKPGKALKDALN